MRRPSGDVLALLALAFAALAVIAPSLAPDKAFVSVHSAIRQPLDTGLTETDRAEYVSRGNFETGDQLFQVLPERREFLSQLGRGELPLWWRGAGGGISLIGAPGGEFTEPRALLGTALLGEIGALGPLAILTIFALAGLTYAFLRLRGLTPLASLTGGLTFALAGALSSNWYYVCKVDALVLLPAGLAAVELWIRGRPRFAFLAMALGAADSALASFPQNTATICYALVLLGGLRLRQARREGAASTARGAVLLLTALVLGLAVAAFHLLPVGEWGSQSDRPFTLSGGGFVFAPAHALSLLTPLAVGDPTSVLSAEFNPVPELLPGLRPYSFTETTLYIGILGIPLTILGALRKRRAAAPLAGLTLAILVAAGTPAAWLPGVGVSAPSRALAIASFFLAWLAAEGMDAASEPRSPRRRWIAAAAGAAWLLTLAGAAALATSALDGAAVAQGALETRGAPEALTGAASVARERFAARWDLEVEPELRHTAGVAILSAILWVVVLWRPRFRGLWTVALAADLAALAMHLTPACPVRNLLEENPEVRAVARAAAGGRVVRIAPQLPLTARDFELFQATLPPWYGIDDTAAYVVMPNARQAAVVRAFHPAVQEVLLGDTYLTALPKESLDGPILDLLGASAVISRAPLTHPSLDPVCERAGFFVYRRVSYRGFAWIVPRGLPAAGRNEALAAMSSPGFDPAAAALVERRGDGALPGGAGGGVCRANFVNGRTTRVDVAGCGGGFLVTTETVAPGWSAALDGAPAELYTVNGVFQGVFVPPGDHVVTLTYLPRSFVVGSAVSIAAVLAIAFAAVRLPRRGGVLP